MRLRVWIECGEDCMKRSFCCVLFINIIHVIRWMRWTGNVARMADRSVVYGILVGRPDGKRPLGRRPRCRWKDYIKMDLKVGWGSVDWIGLAMHRDRWRAVVSAVVNVRVEICAVLGYYAASSGNSLTTFRCLFGFLIPEDGTDGHLTFRKRLTCALEWREL
jgi:hypothetical protein